jgi:hypothetical protein
LVWCIGLDAFKTILATAITLALVFLGIIFAISVSAINNAAIPDVEYGQVTAKAPVTDITNIKYKIDLADGKMLYVATNQTLYETLQINKTYVFTCLIDIPNDRLIAESAWQTNRTTT